MSDSVDRVFVHALATVRRLPRTGSSRPPPAARLRLYGLYKQSMEGDVEAILPRPTLPPASPDPRTLHTSTTATTENGNNTGANNNSVHRYASRDLRTREAQAEIEKWDAWNACAGISRTEAKRRYISTLIETMKEYASGTAESRELVGELEFVWNQIKSQSGSDPDDNGENSPDGSRRSGGETRSGSGGTRRSHDSRQKEPESPTRKLERAGLKNPGIDFGRGSESASGSRDQPSAQATGAGGSSFFSRRSPQQSDSNSNPQRKRRIRTDSSGLRILSPVSQRDSDSGSVVEGVEEAEPDAADGDEDDAGEDDDGDDNQNLNTAPTSPIVHSHRQRQPVTASGHEQLGSDITTWQSNIEMNLRHLATEIAALREQMSANHLLSSSSFSHTYYSLTRRQRIWHHIKVYLWIVWKQTWRQAMFQAILLAIALVWGRWTGDLRVETWVREKLAMLRKRFQNWLSRDGLIGWWVRRLLRIA